MADAAYVNTTRKFPSYTTAQLEETVIQYEAGTHPLQVYAPVDPAHLAELKTEISNRKAGTSKPFFTPQAPPAR